MSIVPSALLGLILSSSILFSLLPFNPKYRTFSFSSGSRQTRQQDSFISRANKIWNQDLLEGYESCRDAKLSTVFTKKRKQLIVWPNAPSNRRNKLLGPGNGLGNQLFGFSQGVSLAKFSNRQLIIEWKFHELFKYTIDWKAHKKFRSSKKFYSLHHLLNSTPDRTYTYEGSYRDKICSILSPASMSVLSKKEQDFRTTLLHLFRINSSQATKWYEDRVLCVQVLSCIFKHTLQPTRILRETIVSATKGVYKDEELISLHIRLGDKEMVKAITQKQTDIHYEKGRFLPMSFGIRMLEYAKEYGKLLKAKGKKVRFFIATDTSSLTAIAKKSLGSSLLSLDDFGSIGLTEYGNSDVLLRAALDFSILSLSDHVICGPWSTFVNTALLWGRSPTQNIFQCKHEGDWSVFKGVRYDQIKNESILCKRTVLKDYWKGAKPEPM